MSNVIQFIHFLNLFYSHLGSLVGCWILPSDSVVKAGYNRENYQIIAGLNKSKCHKLMFKSKSYPNV